jgi:hypothetical protein
MDRVAGEGASVKLEAELTLSVKVVVAVVEPEVPVTVIVNAPVVAVLVAVSVSTLEVAEDVGLKAAVTPLGMPEAVKATLPVNPPTSVTVMVSVPLLPCLTVREDADGLSVKPVVTLALTVRAMVVVAVVLPEVPVTVTVTGPPVVAVLLAVSVSTLELVEDVGLKAAVTPLGIPEVVNVTLPLKPSTSVTVMVSVAVLPCVMDNVDGEDASVNVGVVDPPLKGNWMLASSDCFKELTGVAS